ncbi:MAG TPA: hypothetical protein VFB27_14220 [Opitutaceae bacterium]|nr:hypothetical protein [Opitutaceae bacterium]
MDESTSLSAPPNGSRDAVPSTAAPFPLRASAAPFAVPTAPPFAPHGSAKPPPSSDDFSFKDLVAMISQVLLIVRSRWPWGLAGALLVGGALGYMVFKRPVEFTADTALLAQSTLDKVIGTQGGDADSDQAKENNLRNHLSMMTSRAFHARLLAAFTPEEKARIASPYLKPGTVATGGFFLDFFDGHIDVERERGREYYTIAVSHVDPDTAILIADRFASEYLNYVQQEYKEANQKGYELLEKQADALREDIAKSESARLDYQKNNGIISRADNQGILTERLKQLDASITDTRIKRVGLETLAKQVRADRARSEYPWDNSYLANAGNNQQLRQDLDTQLALRAVAAERYGPNHPKLKEIEAQIKSIEADIQHNFDDAIRDLDSQVDVANRTEQLLKKEFDADFESSMEIEKLATNYEILSAGVDSKKISLEALEKKIGEASISSKLPPDFMEIVDPAYLVKHRIPRRFLYGIMVCLIALGAFVACPLIASTLDERVTGTGEVETSLGLSLIGAIPVMKMRAEDRAHAVRDRVDTVMGETFLGIIGQLEVGARQRYPKVVLVTSTLPGEGKSLIASNLASAFQQLGKKTLLMDLDLRRPVQHSLHGISSETGFLTWARSGSPLENVLGPGGPLGICKLADGTDLLPAGGVDDQPGRFLISKAVGQLVAFLKNHYEVIVFDTSPAGVFQDALVLGRYSSDSVLVAREGVPPVIQAQKVIEDFSRANLPFLGLILNGFNPATANKKLAYTYKAATKNYGYGHASAGAARKAKTKNEKFPGKGDPAKPKMTTGAEPAIARS